MQMGGVSSKRMKQFVFPIRVHAVAQLSAATRVKGKSEWGVDESAPSGFLVPRPDEIQSLALIVSVNGRRVEGCFSITLHRLFSERHLSLAIIVGDAAGRLGVRRIPDLLEAMSNSTRLCIRDNLSKFVECTKSDNEIYSRCQQKNCPACPNRGQAR